jgi:hypothetical protein
MATFIEARTDPFDAARAELAANIQTSGRDDYKIRRPTRGYQLKSDTYAVIRIMGPDGQFIPVIDSAGEIINEQEDTAKTTYYSNFFITNIAEQRQEKQQIVDTFGESYIFFFGESPRLLQVNGLLLNTADFNWRAEFWANYDKYFRGTKLVELGARLYLIYDDQIIEGFMIGADAQENNENRNILSFDFQMFVTGYTNISKLGDPNFPTSTSTMDYTQLSSYERSLQLWERSRNIQRQLYGSQINAINKKQYFIGSLKKLADMIAAGIIDGGDPDIQGFVRRAMLTVGTALKIWAPSLLTGRPNSFAGPQRTIPLRTKFKDNADEFIGYPDFSTPETNNILSMADKWREMDQKVDKWLSIMKFGLEAYTDVKAIWDVMGRAGRAGDEVKKQGGFRNRKMALKSGILIGTGAIANSSLISRTRPFGMTTIR